MANKKTKSPSGGKALDSCKKLNVKVKGIRVKKTDKDGNSSYLNENCVEVVRYNPITADISLFDGQIKEKLTDIVLDKEGHIHIACDKGNNYLIYQQDDTTCNIVEKNESSHN